jgi:hypothetical protein
MQRRVLREIRHRFDEIKFNTDQYKHCHDAHSTGVCFFSDGKLFIYSLFSSVIILIGGVFFSLVDPQIPC